MRFRQPQDGLAIQVLRSMAAAASLIDPTTGEEYGTAPVSGDADVDLAYRAAARAFETWRDSTPSDRQRALLRIADAATDWRTARGSGT